MKQRTKAYFQIHIAVVLFGFTAIFGELIDISALGIVWWRMGIATLSLLFIPKMISKLRRIPASQLLRISITGILVALHWLTFYGAIKLSNVSVTLSVLATSAFMTSILEPLILRKKFYWYEMLLGLFVIPGMIIIFNFSGQYMTGILMALLSAALAVIFSIRNKFLLEELDEFPVTFIELFTGWLFISPVIIFFWIESPEERLMPMGSEWIYLILLAIICTTVAFTLSLQALRHLSAFAVNITVNLEPVYGILLAFILFQDHEELDNRFFIGSLIIMCSVFLHPLLTKIFGKTATMEKEAVPPV